MPLASAVTVLASTTSIALVTQRFERRGVSITNNTAGTLYVLVGSTAATTLLWTAPITAGSHWETPSFYGGEKINGIWTAASTAAGAQVTEYL